MPRSRPFEFYAAQVDRLMERQYNADPSTRLLIVLGQLGSAATHRYHSPEVNPKARPYGTPSDDEESVGHILLQTLFYAHVSDMNAERCLQMALGDPQASFSGGLLQQYIDHVRGLTDRQHVVDPSERLLFVAQHIGKAVTHGYQDTGINPKARPNRTRGKEERTIGDIILHTMFYANFRGMDLERGLNAALRNLHADDWMRIDSVGNEYLKGISVNDESVVGAAYVDPFLKRGPPEKSAMQRILVASHARPEVVSYFEHVRGIVTDHGGKTCHVANIARERGFPCIVGTGKATEVIEDGTNIHLNGSDGTVTILDSISEFSKAIARKERQKEDGRKPTHRKKSKRKK